MVVCHWLAGGHVIKTFVGAACCVPQAKVNQVSKEALLIKKRLEQLDRDNLEAQKQLVTRFPGAHGVWMFLLCFRRCTIAYHHTQLII